MKNNKQHLMIQVLISIIIGLGLTGFFMLLDAIILGGIFSFEIIFSIFGYFIILCCLIVIGYLILTRKLLKNKFLGLAMISVICSIIFFMSITSPLDKYLFAEINEKNGNKIVFALEEHREDFGYYPDTLNELVPTYLEKVPRSLWLSKYKYTKLYVGYTLSCRVGIGVYHQYLTDTKGWTLDD